MNRANAYRKTAITTASPGQVLIMMYEAAIRYVKKARDCIQQKDIPGKGTAIGKAHDIINELNNTLNHQIGGNITRDLERLYTFMSEQLIKANVENSTAPLEAVQKNLETLLDGWKAAVEQVQKTGAQPPKQETSG